MDNQKMQGANFEKSDPPHAMFDNLHKDAVIGGTSADAPLLGSFHGNWQSAQRTVDKLFGYPTISSVDNEFPPRQSSTPEIARGITSLSDLRNFGAGFGSEVYEQGRDQLDLVLHPNHIGNAIRSASEQLRSALQYVRNTSLDQIAKDAESRVHKLGKSIQDELGQPLTPYKQGKYAAQLAMMFMPMGSKRILTEAEITRLGGIEKLEKLGETDLKSMGIKRYEIPELKLDRYHQSIGASIKNNVFACLEAEIPAPGIVNVRVIGKGLLPGGSGGEFLAKALREHGTMPYKELRFDNIVNEPTCRFFEAGIRPADSVLGKTGTNALKVLGLKPSSYRFEKSHENLSLIIDVE